MTRNRFSRDWSSFLGKNTSLILALFSFLIGLNSCYNEPNSLGNGLIPSEDKTEIFVTDTFKVSAFTVKTDSISTSFYKYAVLGCDNSDIFGKIKADFMTEFSLASTLDTFHKLSGRPMDSVFLEIKLKRSWGEKNKPINIKIFRVNYDIFDINVKKFYIDGLKPISNDLFLPDEVALPFVYSGEDSIKIKFKQEFIDYLKSMPDSAFISHSVLQKYFKGLYITTDDYNNNDGVLYFFENEVSNFKLVIHHKRPTKRGGVDIVVDTVFNMLSSGSPKYTHYAHDYSTARADLKINHFYDFTENAINTQDTVFYIDGLGGVRGMIKLQSAEYWKKLMPIVIHRAELQFDVQPHPDFSSDSLINPLFYYHKRGYESYFTMTSDDLIKIFDYNISGSNSVSYHKAKKYYSIDITLHLQNILKNKIKEDYFFLEPSDFENNYRQGIFRTGNNSKPMKLIITYSKL